MLLKNEFEIDAGMSEAWDFFTDLTRVMPCMPGAALEGVDGENYLGSVKVKVGPIGAHFRGTAHFAQKDDATHSAVIVAVGKDPKGQASASAQIHARLEPVADKRTRVLLDTDLDISGRMAQFGRGAIADVSNRLLGQFVQNISEVIGNDGAAAPSVTAGPATTGPGSSTTSPPPTVVAATSNADGGMDVVALVGPMLKERYAQAIVGGLIGFVLSWLVFGRHVRRQRHTMPVQPVPWPGQWPMGGDDRR